MGLVGMIGAAWAEPPAAVWWSVPAEPGELVQIHGGAWGAAPAVEVTEVSGRSLIASGPRTAGTPDFGRATRVQPAKITDTGICFELPRGVEAGLLACRIVSASGEKSKPFVLNAPEVWWTQGDLGTDASPGGWLRLFGRCLDRNGKARVVLSPENGGRDIEPPLAKRDIWSIDAPLPHALPQGAYRIYVHNGAGGREGWREAGRLSVRPYSEVWKSDRFEVTSFGAVPNDGMDDTDALQAALDAAGANGGGTVYLPRGRFQCNATLRIPERTLLRGESRETTELYWPDVAEPLRNLIEGTSAFGVEDLFIQSGNYYNGIVCRNAPFIKQDASSAYMEGGVPKLGDAEMHDITVRRVRLSLIDDQFLTTLRDGKKGIEYEQRTGRLGNALVFRNVRFVRVEDCDIFSSNRGYFLLTGEDLRVSGCTLNGTGCAFVGGDRVIYENNEARMCTYSIMPECRNLFWSNNRQSMMTENNREGITHDRNCTAFRPLLPGHCEGTRVTLDFGKEPLNYAYGTNFWIGLDLQIVDGRGAGQTRTVKAIDGPVVTFDRPWDIAPDKTSRFLVTFERKHLLYVDNRTEDVAIAIQLYGGATDGVLSRNRCARSGGFLGFGMTNYGSVPLWFVQFLDNTIDEGNSYRGPQNDVPPTDSVMEIRDHGRLLTLTRSCVIRRGVCENNANVGIASANGFIENCTVRNADLGLAVGSAYVKQVWLSDITKFADTIVLKGNRFENVFRPMNDLALQRAVMNPAERGAAMLAGARTALGEKTPGSWKRLERELGDLAARTAINDPHAETVARAILLQAIRELEKQGSPEGGFAFNVAESLLGASFDTRPWNRDFFPLFSGTEAASGKSVLPAGIAPLVSTASCSLAFAELPGWQLSADTTVLKPGTSVHVPTRGTSPSGAKGIFRLPTSVVYRGKDWKLTFAMNLRPLESDPLGQWAVSDGREWRPLVQTNHYGKMLLDGAFGAASPTSVVAVAVLRVTRPTTVLIRHRGRSDDRLFIDGRRYGSDMGFWFHWGSLRLTPGEHVLKLLTQPPEKKQEWYFNAYIEVADSFLPGDVTPLSAQEAVLWAQNNATSLR